MNKILSQEKISAAGQGALVRTQDLLRAFLEDQQFPLLVYLLIGIVGFFIFSKGLKYVVGGLAARIVMKLILVVALFGGVYLFYVSWLNDTILEVNQNPSTAFSEHWPDQMTTPREILKKTEDIVDQFNQKAKERESLLKQMDENTVER